MIFLTKQLIKFLSLLHSETSTRSISVGFAIGCLLGFSPTLSIQGLLLLICLLVFRIQTGAAFISALAFSFIAYIFDGQADQLGRWILEMPALIPTWNKLYQIPLVPLTRFNNSIVMGSIFVSLVLALPVYFLSEWAVAKYRSTVVQKIKQSAFWKSITATKVYTWYAKYQELYG